jgi:hypothetical protein
MSWRWRPSRRSCLIAVVAAAFMVFSWLYRFNDPGGAFTGGHADLRPGFFKTEEGQRLVVERLQRQSAPMILLEAGDSLGGFRDSFPIVTACIDRMCQMAATRVFDRRFGITLFVRRDAKPEGTWAPLGWPGYARGQVVS